LSIEHYRHGNQVKVVKKKTQ